MFTGLSAFPLTPLREGEVDDASFVALIERLVSARVDSITVLGSTGAFAYLSAQERRRVTALAARHAQSIPLFVGVSALRLSDVLEHIRDAEDNGADAVLLSAMSYTPLGDDEVFRLYATAAEASALPIIVYDNPVTTHFRFDLDLYGRVAALPAVVSIKIPGVPDDPDDAQQHIAAVRRRIPDDATIGVSGDPFAARGLLAGCDAWYSVIGGVLPRTALQLTRAACSGDLAVVDEVSRRLSPLWDLIRRYGGMRVAAAIAEHYRWAAPDCLPAPVDGLAAAQRAHLAEILEDLDLG